MNDVQRFYISGHVQGVFYRASTQQKATELGLTGWVRNLPDGRVEVLACGDSAQLKQLEAWLWQGPSGARVDDVKQLDADPDACGDYTQFEVLR